MAQTMNEEVLPQEMNDDTDTGVRVSPEEPGLLTQPSALPILPLVDGKPLRFVSPEKAQAKKTQASLARKTGVWSDPAGQWFNYALLALLLMCAASSAVMLISTTFR